MDLTSGSAHFIAACSSSGVCIGTDVSLMVPAARPGVPHSPAAEYQCTPRLGLQHCNLGARSQQLQLTHILSQTHMCIHCTIDCAAHHSSTWTRQWLSGQLPGPASIHPEACTCQSAAAVKVFHAASCQMQDILVAACSVASCAALCMITEWQLVLRHLNSVPLQ